MKTTRRTAAIHHDRGFTLVEVLTAIMILAISMTTLFHLFSEGLKSARVSNDYTHAIFYAREKMEEALLSESLSVGEKEGTLADGYRWKLTVVSMEPEAESTTPPGKSSIHLFQVTVGITWDTDERQRTFAIQTLHLANRLEKDANA